VRKCLVSRILSLIMAVVLPTSLFAADSERAMLYSGGTVSLNGSSSPASSVIFSGDLIQTTAGSVAKINASGSSLLVLSDSLVQFDGSTVNLDHGGVTVSTSKALATRAGDITVTPKDTAWTQFDVSSVDGNVQIVAKEGDLTIDDPAGTTTLAQGQQTTVEQDPQTARNESEQGKKKKKNSSAAAPAGVGGVLDSPIVIGAGAAVVIGITAWVLFQGGNPVSATKP
jgi:hypothetical protein